MAYFSVDPLLWQKSLQNLTGDQTFRVPDFPIGMAFSSVVNQCPASIPVRNDIIPYQVAAASGNGGADVTITTVPVGYELVITYAMIQQNTTDKGMFLLHYSGLS